MKAGMERSGEPREFELPLELQFSMRKAELAAQEMTWEELLCTLLNLYHQRLMEWYAIKDILAAENISIDFDIPTDLDEKIKKIVSRLAEDEDELQPF